MTDKPYTSPLNIYKKLIIAALSLIGLCGIIYYILIPSPSSPLFSPHRFKSIFYSQESINQIFQDHTYPGMSRSDLEKIIFRAGGGAIRQGDSMEKKKRHPALGYGLHNTESLAKIMPSYYIDYTLPSIGIPNLSSGRRVTAHFDEENKIEVLFVNGILIIP